jgi:purine nucleosidase
MAHQLPVETPILSAARRVFIDCDAGIDDALALILALRDQDPAFEIVGISACHGNVALPLVVGNICACLEAVQRTEIPVYIGSAESLLGGREEDASEWHGTDGLGHTNFGTAASQSSVCRDKSAYQAIADAACESSPLDVIVLGPCTNLAIAVKLYPELSERINKVYIMGGAYQAKGNVTLTAEYNMKSDPEAAALVFNSFPRIVLASWELTMAYGLPASVLPTYLRTDTSVGKWVSTVSKHLVQANDGAAFSAGSLLLPDPLCVAIALQPSLITKSTTQTIVVETGGKYSRGMTIVDWNDMLKKAKNVEIVTEIDMKLFTDMLLHSTR